VTGGGYNGTNLSSAEVYDPESGTWQPAGTMPQGRGNHTATLLANGRVLVAGGLNSNSAPALLYGRASAAGNARGPRITSSSTPVAPSGALELSGLRLIGASEASGGATQQSATRLPLVRLQGEGGGAVVWLPIA